MYADELDSAIAVIDNVNDVSGPAILSQYNLTPVYAKALSDLLSLSIIDEKSELYYTQYTNLSSIQNNFKTKFNKIISKLKKNDTVVKSQVVPTTSRLAALGTKVLDQFEQLFKNSTETNCMLYPLSQGTVLESYWKFDLQYAEYLYKLARCGRSRLDQQIMAIQRGDEDDLSSLVSLLDVIGSSISAIYEAGGNFITGSITIVTEIVKNAGAS